MTYNATIPGKFIERPNRFVAICMLEGEQVAAHVKNTGRCRELLTPGAFVFLQYHPAAGRKTDLRQRRRRWIRFDTTQGIIPAQFGQVPQRIPDNKISPCCAGFSGPGRAKPSLRR